MTFDDLTGIDDPRLPEAMDLYQNSFPDRECASFSWWFRFWREMAEPSPPRHRFFTVALTPEAAVAGIAVYEIKEEVEGTAAVGFLINLATDPALRGQGIGAELFGEVAHRCFTLSCRALVWEVEDPDEVALSQGAADAELARRRIGFYRRCGGHLLGGVRYELRMSGRPHLPPFPMHIMAAAVAGGPPLTPDDTLRLANLALSPEDDGGALAVRQIGPLTLE